MAAEKSNEEMRRKWREEIRKRTPEGRVQPAAQNLDYQVGR